MKLSYEELEQKLKKVEKQLAESKACNKKKKVQNDFEELFAVFNGYEGAAHVVDMNTYEILAANKYTEKLYGENLIGDLCYKRYHKELDAPCKSCRNKLLIDENDNIMPPTVYEFINPVNGRWFQCTDKAIRWPDGRLVKMEIALDIHNWKLTADALRASEEKFKTLISQLPDVVVVHRNNKLLFLSEQMFKITGKLPHDYKDLTFLDFLHPDDKVKVLEISKKRLNGESVPDKYDVQIKGIGPDYHTFEVRGTIIEYEGEKATLTVLTNITENKKIEEALHHKQEQYFNLVENAVDAIFHGDPAGNFIGANPRACEMTGYTKEELLTMNMGQLFTPYQVSSRPLRYDLLKEGQTVRTERIITRKDGSTLPIEMNTKMMPDKTYQSFFRDFSERKKMEEELINAKDKAEESDKLKSAFLANMSHEIRTPLNGILGFTDILINESLVDSKRKEFLEIIEMNGKQLLAIINDIIDISKIEAGQVKVNSVNCFLNQLMFDIFSVFNLEIEEKCENKIKFNLLIPSERSILIHVDDLKITQVLNNLISNAIKFTHDGSIDIGYTIDIEKYIIQFFVKDSGIGLSFEKQLIIFERFRQADDTTTRNYGGTGLGLTISKGLVELMGGQIWVQSDKGKGTVFYFTIPYNPIIVKEAIDEPDKIYNKSVYDWSGITILIVEDDDDSFLYLETIFEKNKALIYRAENGKEAVEFCKKNKNISIVLMDIQTPVMNGYEATRLIREFDSSLPIIAQTANAFEEDREKCIAVGCNDYIMKPIDVKLLNSMIDSFLKKRL